MKSFWTDNRNRNECLSFVAGVSGLLHEHGGPLTRQVTSLLRDGNYVDVVNFKFDYTAPFETRRKVEDVYDSEVL
jgi:hypothetical protein